VLAKALHYSYIFCNWQWDSGSLIKWLCYGSDHRGIAIQFPAGSEVFPFSKESGPALGPRNFVLIWKQGLLFEGWSSWNWLLTCTYCSSNECVEVNSILHKSAWHSAKQSTHRDSFTTSCSMFQALEEKGAVTVREEVRWGEAPHDSTDVAVMPGARLRPWVESGIRKLNLTRSSVVV
jgi:hypothetical protein